MLFVLASNFSIAQNTYVRKLSYTYMSSGYGDTLTGPKQIEVGADGSLFVLANTGPQNSQTLFKFYPNSTQLDWSVFGGYNGMMASYYIERFKPTSDSGVIICSNFYDEMLWLTRGTIVKYDKNGNDEWSEYFTNPYAERKAWDVLERPNGNYLVLIDDTMYTLDHSGNAIDSTGAISGTRFKVMSNGDLLLLSGSTLMRIDTTGNVIWMQNCNGAFAYDTTSVFIVNGNTSVMKVDAMTGNTIWNFNYGFSPISDIEATHDGGFMASVGTKPSGPTGAIAPIAPGILFRADVNGDTIWTRNYPLGYHGLSSFTILPDGSISTGGGYLSGYILGGFSKEYSAFCAVMNADGSYPLLQTNYLVPGDANHDRVVNFVDDALTIMLSLGQTGVPRDTAIIGYDPLYSCDKVNIATDWSGNSVAGVNYKYADTDGNGIVDTNDVLLNYYCMSDSFAVPFRFQHSNLSQSIEEFCLVPVEDTIYPQFNDTAYYYMIMGSVNNPVDSIYGFAFSYSIDDWGNNRADSIWYNNGSMGIQGMNVFAYHDQISQVSWSAYRAHTMICRTDFHNIINVNDTIGIIRFTGYFNSSPFSPTIADFKAILADGSEIPFNVCTSSIYIDSSYVTVSEFEKNKLIVFPNPADRELEIRNKKLGNGTAQIYLFNMLGEKVKSILCSSANLKISVEDLPDGFYTAKFVSETGTKNFSFVIQH